MERIRKSPNPEPVIVDSVQLHWKKIGGGSLRLKNQIIKPNQTFWATLEEIPKSFRDRLICLEDSKLEAIQTQVKKETQTPEVLYKLKKAGKGLFNVANLSGKVINEVPLTEDAANELKAALEA